MKIKRREVPPVISNHEKALKANKSLLQFVANAGSVRRADVVRFFARMDATWHNLVLDNCTALLAYAYTKDERIRAQFLPSAKVLAQLMEPFEFLSDSPRQYMSRVNLRGIIRADLTQYVDFMTGRPVKNRDDGILYVHWVRARSVAVELVNAKHYIHAGRVISRLIEADALEERRAEDDSVTYAINTNTRRLLGPDYAAVGSRSLRNSDHKTLALGYLMIGLNDGVDAWTEGSLTNTANPGIRGSLGMKSNRELFEGVIDRAGAYPGKVHPADGVIATRESLGDDYDDWGLELVEAERGSKQVDEFVRSLYPLINGQSPDAVVMGGVVTSDGVTRTRRFRIKRITYVMADEGFLEPIFNACRQFVTGTQVIKGSADVPAKTRLFIGDASANEGNPQKKWQELLEMVTIRLCPLSPKRRAFLGVSFSSSLWELAQAEGKTLVTGAVL